MGLVELSAIELHITDNVRATLLLSGVYFHPGLTSHLSGALLGNHSEEAPDPLIGARRFHIMAGHNNAAARSDLFDEWRFESGG